MGIITFIEITNLIFFENSFEYVKVPFAWFIGISVSFIFSNFLQKTIFSLFRKNVENKKEKEDFFLGFILALVITALITPYLKELMIFFFDTFVAYVHVIIMQSLIIIYLLFKLKGGYEISGKYFITNQMIVLVNTIILLYSIA
jgi:hypothetical protein